MDKSEEITLEKEKRKYSAEEKMIIKNMLVISLAFLCCFTAFQSMQNLQSSINCVDGLGTHSLSAIYGAVIVSSMFIPAFMMRQIGAKWTLVVSMLGYSFYIAAQFYPTFSTLIPAAIICGLASAPLWTSQSVYMTIGGKEFALSRGASADTMISKFFGIFWFIFQNCMVWGNVISSVVLASDPVDIDYSRLDECGINFCYSGNGTSCGGNIERPSDAKIYTLATIYLVSSLLGVAILAVFINPLDSLKLSNDGHEKEKLSGFKLLIATFHQMKVPKQLLIIPITVFSGVSQAFIRVDFTQAYISCAWGVHNIGYVLIAFGVCTAICSWLVGSLVQVTGRVPIFTTGAALNLAVIIACYMWHPSPDDAVVFFVLAGLWGMAEAVWNAQISDSGEAAFSSLRLWQSIGFMAMFLIQDQICIATKLPIVITVLLLGMATYYTAEILHTKSSATIKPED